MCVQALERRLPGLVAHPQRGVLRRRAGVAGGAAQLLRRQRGARAAGGAGRAHRRAEGRRRQAGRRQAAGAGARHLRRGTHTAYVLNTEASYNYKIEKQSYYNKGLIFFY